MIGNKKSTASKMQIFLLKGKTYSVSHLQSNLQIFQNTYSSFAHLIIWVVLFFSYWVAWVSYIKLIWSPYQISDLQIFFHSIGCHLILMMASFTMQKFWVWCGLTSLFLQLLPLLLMTDLLSCLYFWKGSFISCFTCYHLLPFLPKDTDWMNGYKNKTHIYAAYKRPTSVVETYTDWKWEYGKRYFMQTEIRRKLDWQFSFRKK